MKTVRIISAASFAALLCASCSHRTGWGIEGTVDGIEAGQKLVLEASNGKSWYVVDSIETGKDGRFDYESARPASYGEIMRLTLPGKGSVFFPVDSVDKVTLTASAATFGSSHRLSGSYTAERFSLIDSIVASTADIDEIRTRLTQFITVDTTGTVAYYAVSKAKGAQPVFDPLDDKGNRIYGAAANVFATYRPDDARGEILKQTFFYGRKALGKVQPVTTEIEATTVGLFEIERYDNKGVRQSLSDLASKKGVVVLSFTDYSDANSPAYNVLLNDVYTKYKDQGLEIYQVALDANEVNWKQAASNLPWITVWNSPMDDVSGLAMYNINVLPLTYVIDRNGDLAERVENPDDIESAVRKHI